MSKSKDELAAFLADVHFVLPNLNDTFVRACADSEQITVGDGEAMARFWREYGWYGLVAIAAKKRDREPLPPVADHPNYKAARKALDSFDPVDPDEDAGWCLLDEFELR